MAIKCGIMETENVLELLHQCRVLVNLLLRKELTVEKNGEVLLWLNSSMPLSTQVVKALLRRHIFLCRQVRTEVSQTFVH